MFSLSVVSVPRNTSSSRSSSTFLPSSNRRLCGPWTRLPLSSRVPSLPVSPSVLSHLVSLVDTTSWPLCNLSRRATTQSNTVCLAWTERTDANTLARSLCKRVSVSRQASPSRSRSSVKSHLALPSCTRTFCTLATRMFAQNIPRILVSHF